MVRVQWDHIVGQFREMLSHIMQATEQQTRYVPRICHFSLLGKTQTYSKLMKLLHEKLSYRHCCHSA